MDVKSFTTDSVTMKTDIVEGNLEVHLIGKSLELGLRLTPTQAEELYTTMEQALDLLSLAGAFDNLDSYLYEDGLDVDAKKLQKQTKGDLLRHSDRGGVINPDTDKVGLVRNTPTPVEGHIFKELGDDSESLDRHLPESKEETGKPAVDTRPKGTSPNKPISEEQSEQNKLEPTTEVKKDETEDDAAKRGVEKVTDK